MATTKQLLSEIEALRKKLQKIIDLSGGNLLSQDVIKTSEKLDRLLVQYLKENAKRSKNKPND